jgi:hypothetical protein
MAGVFTSEESTMQPNRVVPSWLQVDAQGGEESQMFHEQTMRRGVRGRVEKLEVESRGSKIERGRHVPQGRDVFHVKQGGHVRRRLLLRSDRDLSSGTTSPCVHEPGRRL